MSNQPTRFSQAQVLIAALFTVVMTGKMPQEKPRKPEAIHPIFENPPYGIYSRAARRACVTRGFAWRVAHGVLISHRVAKVLIEEAELAVENSQVRQFSQGTYSAVARKLGVSPSHVSNVALGIRTSSRVSAELARFAKQVSK